MIRQIFRRFMRIQYATLSFRHQPSAILSLQVRVHIWTYIFKNSFRIRQSNPSQLGIHGMHFTYPIRDKTFFFCKWCSFFNTTFIRFRFTWHWWMEFFLLLNQVWKALKKNENFPFLVCIVTYFKNGWMNILLFSIVQNWIIWVFTL